uniref:Uncharacterized protein n=1 Tax=Arundo donax TaxID=35708 RepID=A0A0A8Z3V4_ARUDO
MRPRNQIERTKDERGGGYRLQVVIHGDNYKQKWSRHLDRQEPQVRSGRRLEAKGPDYPDQAGR